MILVLNCGSSSMKYRVFGAGEDVRGTVERIGQPGGPAGHGAALVEVFQRVPAHGITAVGHRIVHGGTRYQHPVVVDDRVLSGLRELVPLAPLHNPAGIAGIEAARQHLPGAVQVAAFDTAFHAHLPDVAATYAIDQDVARHTASAATASTASRTSSSPPGRPSCSSAAWRS